MGYTEADVSVAFPQQNELHCNEIISISLITTETIRMQMLELME